MIQSTDISGFLQNYWYMCQTAANSKRSLAVPNHLTMGFLFIKRIFLCFYITGYLHILQVAPLRDFFKKLVIHFLLNNIKPLFP